MTRAAICVAVGVSLVAALAGSSARAGRASLHDIPWYVAHPAARRATLDVCHSDHRFSHDADCANADTAETRAWTEERRRAAGDILSDPNYWAGNPLGRGAVLTNCARQQSFYDPKTCAAARQGEALSRGR